MSYLWTYYRLQKHKEGWGYAYQALFGDHPEGEGVIVKPRSILRCISRRQVPWMDLRFDLKAESRQFHDAWVEMVLAILGIASKMLYVWVKRPLTVRESYQWPEVIKTWSVCSSRNVKSHGFVVLRMNFVRRWKTRLTLLPCPCMKNQGYGHSFQRGERREVTIVHFFCRLF